MAEAVFFITAFCATKRGSVLKFCKLYKDRKRSDAPATTASDLFSALLKSIASLLQRVEESHISVVANECPQDIPFHLMEGCNSGLIVQPHSMIADFLISHKESSC